MLKSITNGNSNPKGKPRVYFCCHPGEQSLFLNPISETLLAKQNCALWYLEDPNTERDADFWTFLKEVQLFVMPVTTRLLTTENPAMDEFRFAMEKNIPVLPLMQESELAVLFNEKCGDLQFLDPNLADPTAISYEEKLQKYLSAVLIGDELAKKVREAFDAYVFLSYRKKDRRHARTLMALIHQFALYRDVAIWYDEYLTPGEDFNKAIEDALKQCDLFALAVTPSLLEKVPDQDGVLQENYVTAHEYPMARNSGKPILPVRMQPTDRAALAIKYEALPLCIDGYDADALSNALEDNLRQLPLGAKRGDAEHNYLIGLAYLNGIDVEVDYSRAVALITTAAENNCIEAVTQLAHMYRVGLGVKRNYETAVHWLEKGAALLEKQYGANPTEENLESLFYALINCGDSYQEMGKTDQTQRCYETALHYAEIRGEAQPSSLSVAYQKVAAVYETKGDWEAARSYLDKSLKLQETLCKDGTAEVWYNLALGYEQWGDMCIKNRDFTGARKVYDASLDIFEMLAKEIGSDEALQDVGVICNRIGELCRLTGDLTAAKAFYQRSLDIREKLAKARGSNDRLQANLATCYERMGNLSKDAEDPEAAEAYYQKALAIRAKLAKETGLSLHRRDLMVSYLQLGSLDSTIASRNYSLQALTLAKALVNETGTVQAHMDLSNAFDSLGAHWEEEDIALARDYYAQALEVSKTLTQLCNAPVIHRNLINHLITMVRICEKQGDLPAAREYCDEGIALGTTLAENTPSDELYEVLIMNCMLGGHLFEAEGNLEAAIAQYEYTMELTAPLLEKNATVEIRRIVSMVCLALGKAYTAMGNTEGARYMLSCSAGMINEVAEETGKAEDLSASATSYLELANLLREMNETERALDCYACCLEIRQSLAEDKEDTDAQRKLVEVFHKVAELYIAAGYTKEAESFFLHSLNVSKALAELTGESEDLEIMAMDYSNIAYARKAQGRVADAKALYERCLGIRETIARKTNTVDALDRVGRTLLKLLMVDQENADAYAQYAAQIYFVLTQRAPGNPQFREFLTMLSQYL